MLSEFERIVPGAAERIVAQFEQEAEHRRELERKQTRFVIHDTHIGQAIAGAFALTSLGIAAYAISEGAQWAATVIGGGVVIPIVYAFLRQTLKGR